ncbi:sensor domain-containing diguanylate cyclase [Helicovermis profundi]|uniref:Diguanylate cyclase n=1 Tax=Helicovermis profundi TaxID=3065157 RepID=A0AAU9ETQ6_9FIRM|nr:hypothetical protein HLPR_07610 [Clostridia bacterium S502]
MTRKQKRISIYFLVLTIFLETTYIIHNILNIKVRFFMFILPAITALVSYYLFEKTVLKYNNKFSTSDDSNNDIKMIKNSSDEDSELYTTIKKIKKEFEGYLESANIIFLILGEKAKINMINNRGANILKTSKEKVLGKNWIEEFVPLEIRSSVEEVFYNIYSGSEEMEEYYENEIIAKDGSVKILGWYNTVLRNDDNKVIEILSVGIDLTEKKELEKKLNEKATIDIMTNTYNRNEGIELFKKQYHIAKRTKQNLTVCFIDINGLKKVNDTMGHDFGDELITIVTKVINDEVRESDIVSRLGGDEFLIVFPNTTIDEAEVVLKRINNEYSELNTFANRGYDISVSYGYSEYHGEVEKSHDSIIIEADKNMYNMKKKFKQSKNIKNL